MNILSTLFFCVGLLLQSGIVSAAEPSRFEPLFTMGIGSQPTSLDPQHRVALIANLTLTKHIFDAPYYVGKNNRIQSRLIKEHQVEDPRTWLFTLKEGVKFHDGHELTSDDIIATFNRVKGKSKDNSFRQFLGDVDYEKVNSRQFRIKTPQPNPELPSRLLGIHIISKHYEHADPEVFESGEALVGTGPYRFVKQTDMKQFELKAFEDYHGGAPFLQHVLIKAVADKDARLSGLKDGDLDLIDRLSINDLETLQNSSNSRLSMHTGTAFSYITLDQHLDESPFLFDHKGLALKNNPFKDRRVRKAISKVIDRQKLVDEFFDGKGAVPTAQLVPKGYPGYMPNWEPDSQDIKLARELLAEAGFPDGFMLKMHGKNSRKPIIESIASMLDKINIKVEVETATPQVYNPMFHNHELSVGFRTYDAFGNIKSLLTAILQTGRNGNGGRYSSPVFDGLLNDAMKQFDEDVRYREYSYAMEFAMKDYAIIPLLFISPISAIRKDMVYSSYAANYTLAQEVTPE